MVDVTTASAEATAAGMGVVDALLFRRLSPTRWAHLGGFGRGRGWAGLVDVDVDKDPLLAKVPAEPGGVHRFAYQQSGRVLGPYYAVSGAVVRVTNDVVVILGNPTQALLPDSTEDDLRALASQVDAEIEEISPSKRLADELEVLHAVRAVTTGGAPDLLGTLQHVVDVAVEALSCEVGLLRDDDGNTVTTSTWSGVDAEGPDVAAALDTLAQRASDGALCIQDTSAEQVTGPLGHEHGVRSLLVINVPPPLHGVLAVAHTSAGPRGFTTLCQQLGAQLVEAASVVAHTAALRDDLRAVADEQGRAARRDSLTGLGNRLAWDEALVLAQEELDAGACFTVVTLDVDGLKQLNDTCGHEAGDELLCRCAEVLRDHARDEDLIVRLGGDEFALLLPVVGHLAEERVASLAVRLGGLASCEESVAASVGAGTALTGGSVADAAREADAAMYAAKRSRRQSARQEPASA